MYIYRILLFRDIRQANVWRTRDKAIEQGGQEESGQEVYIFCWKTIWYQRVKQQKIDFVVQMHVNNT